MDKEDNILLEEYCYVRTKQKVSAPDVEKAWQRFEREHLTNKKVHKPLIRTLFYRYAAAVAVLLLLVIGGMGLWWTREGEQVVETCKTRKYIHEVMRQGDGLLVAFESTHAPQKILMGCDENSLRPIDRSISCKGVQADTVKAVFSCRAKAIMDIAMRTIITPRGKTYEVVLSDGSEVVLNADSKLVFPVNFEGNKERKVKLVGEAFFKVAKDSEHPFVVETPLLSTTVLGTEFDVRAYVDGSSKVTLLSGSVKVAKTGASLGKESVVLSPNQEVVLADNQSFDVLNLSDDAVRTVSWKEGLFVFRETPLLEAIKDIGRWYNVDVELTDNSLKTSTISLSMPRKVSLVDFVNSINLTNNLSAVLENGKIVICPKDASRRVNLFSLYDAHAVQADETIK